MKTTTIHARVLPEIKEEADKIFKSVGLKMSQAIALFLTATINQNGLPFELKNLRKDDDRAFKFAKSVATVDGVAPTKDAEDIFKEFANGKIDYKTAQKKIENLYK